MKWKVDTEGYCDCIRSVVFRSASPVMLNEDNILQFQLVTLTFGSDSGTSGRRYEDEKAVKG